MKKYSDYGIDCPETGSGEYYATCPRCSQERKKQGVKSLSVNLDKGVWNCHHCGFKGHLEHTDEEKRDYAITTNNSKTPRKEAAIEKFNASPVKLLALTEKALGWLKNERGISEDTATLAGLQSSFRYMPQAGRKIEVVAFPFYRDEKIVNVKYRGFEKQFSQEPGGMQCFYQFNALKDADSIIITEGELDTLALMEAGFNNAVSCPSGAPPLNAVSIDGKLSFIDDAGELLAGISKVILATDKDQPGMRWETAISKKIGVEKCYSVQYPPDCKDCNDVLKKHGREKLAECIKNAKPLPVKGIATFKDFEKQIQGYRASGGKARGASTGFNNLDEYFRLCPGTLNIVTGIPGSGKSEFLDQVMINSIGLHNWKWCIFSPENYPIESHFQKLAEKLFDKPLFKGYSKDPLTDEEIKNALNAFSEYIKILTIDEESITIDEILERVKLCKVRYGINGFILDPYNEVEHSRPSGMSETEYISSFLSKVRNFGRLHNIAMFIVAHPVKLFKKEDGEYPVPTPYDISGSAHWRNKADSCLSVWRSYTRDENKVQIHIQKIRNKNAGKIGKVEFNWTKATGKFTEVKRYE